MDEYITNYGELERMIDRIPVPDITVSSLSQQSEQVTPQSKKQQSLTREQVQKIMRRVTEQSHFPTTKQKIYTLQTFNCKESSNDEQLFKQLQQRDHNKNEELLKMQQQVCDQQKVIQQQIQQIAQMNNQIEFLTNELQEYQEKSQSDVSTLQQLNAINDQQKKTIEEIRIELLAAKRVSSYQLNKEQDSIQQITQLKSKINSLQSEINKTRTNLTLTSPTNETIQTGILTNRIDPELLSEDDTLNMLLCLLSRVSKSQRMTYLLKKNADFKYLIKLKRSQPSINKISFIQNSKSVCDRKLSYNQENFKQIVKNVGIKNH
ncbi:unnamed protein product [Paramecium octaurelia]|uniref:Uncharacterized protein n=1 Tax=Paramecium octaurelia TaxID=43137 RepID=A0A8S1S274_PAROT|nr:unnamed protein product [Paramecium octaurelia]